ncbi:MAG: hypothetical protein AAFO88_06380 [Pseudomonadota bacterium]
MPIDYVAEFPIPADSLPERLRTLLEPVGTSPQQMVEVTTRYDAKLEGMDREYVHMIMAAVPEDSPDVTTLLEESRNGVVSFSVPAIANKGDLAAYSPSISGYDYIVASRGDGSFYTYSLAEKVWMSMGLSVRCVGNEEQRLVYDDLSLPQLGVAAGEASNEYYWKPNRNVRWTMSNEYLRKYLWMRGAFGVRVFFYQALQPDSPALRALMNGTSHIVLEPDGGWYEVDIREHDGGLLLQVWGTVKAVTPELCPEQTADGLAWPNVKGAMTHARANSLVHPTHVFLNDKFLERYEQNSVYDSVPVLVFDRWSCSPSYLGQWSFTDCMRVGRNLIRVPMRELYKPKPDREIVHAYGFALSAAEVAHFDQNEEHIVAKVARFLDQLLSLGDNLSTLADRLGIDKPAVDIVHFSRAEVASNGWAAYPNLPRLAQVAPLDMTEQAFLARCKSLHEIWQRVPGGFLKQLLRQAGCPQASLKSLGTLRLLQAILNIVAALNANEENADAFQNNDEPLEWNTRNEAVAALFINYDLRIADAHETFAGAQAELQRLGFDIANVNQGYGRALDFVMDQVILSFATINVELSALLHRGG